MVGGLKNDDHPLTSMRGCVREPPERFTPAIARTFDRPPGRGPDTRFDRPWMINAPNLQVERCGFNTTFVRFITMKYAARGKTLSGDWILHLINT